MLVELTAMLVVQPLRELGARIDLAVRFVEAARKQVCPHPEKGEGYDLQHLYEDVNHLGELDGDVDVERVAVCEGARLRQRNVGDQRTSSTRRNVGQDRMVDRSDRPA